MEWSPCCPKCLSHFYEVRGKIYSGETPEGVDCADDWHRGPSYQPAVLILTEEDRKFLKDLLVGVEG